MIRRLSEVSAAFARRFVPDPFVLAILLTALTFAASLAAAEGPFGARVARLVGVWGGSDGLWAPPLLAFTVQIMLVLVTGHALAATRPVRRAIDLLAERPASTGSAVALTALLACGTGLLNWGLSLIVGALFARQVGASCRRRGVRVHYPLVVAAGYTGLMVWHGGLSGSAPLKVTTARDVSAVVTDPAVVRGVTALVAARDPSAEAGSIPLGLTIFSPTNLVVTLLVLVAIPALLAAMAPRDAAEVQEIDDATARAALDEPAEAPPLTPAEQLDASRLVAFGLVALGAAYFALRFAVSREWTSIKGVKPLGVVDLDTINLAFFVIGLALHGSIRSYGRAVGDAVGGAAGILVQFPLYFGMLAMMKESGVVVRASEWLAAASGGSAGAYASLTFLIAGAVSVVIPSGGGQWAVQGPIVLHGAVELGADPGKAVLALAYGDQWANMLQPFWALPLLGICGVRAGDIMGYTVVLMLLSTPLFLLPLALV